MKRGVDALKLSLPVAFMLTKYTPLWFVFVQPTQGNSAACFLVMPPPPQQMRRRSKKTYLLVWFLAFAFALLTVVSFVNVPKVLHHHEASRRMRVGLDRSHRDVLDTSASSVSPRPLSVSSSAAPHASASLNRSGSTPITTSTVNRRASFSSPPSTAVVATSLLPAETTKAPATAHRHLSKEAAHNSHKKLRKNYAAHQKGGRESGSFATNSSSASVPPTNLTESYRRPRGNLSRDTFLSERETQQRVIRTYDDLIARDLDPKHYQYVDDRQPHGIGVNSKRKLQPLRDICDPFHVPFSAAADAMCIQFVSDAVVALSQQQYYSTRSRQDDNETLNKSSLSVPAVVEVHGRRVSVDFEPIPQRFEQRTIKFKLTIRSDETSLSQQPQQGHGTGDDDSDVIAVILKVPQVLFPIEPFAEVAAFDIDRLLRLHRVPPTALVALPFAWIQSSAKHRRSNMKMGMVPEFLEASHVSSYDEWIEKDFVNFVAPSNNHDKAQKFRRNATHVWCSLQLFLAEVQPLLYSPLKVPYSKQNPGWHRWFDVMFQEYRVPEGPLMALSELAVFDAIIMNNDRSPNKNNFVVGMCKSCPVRDRRPSGLVPTFVHLDHGMSFYGKDIPISHNPIAKGGKRVRFCIFYKPQIRILWHLERLHPQLEHMRKHHADVDDLGGSIVIDDSRREVLWRRFVLAAVNPVVAAVIGESKIEDVGSQVIKVLRRVDWCLKNFTGHPELVLRP